MTPPTHELEAYFAGDCTDEQFRAIEAWLHADPAHAKQFMHELHFRELVGERVRERSSDTAAIIAELARLEAAAHPPPVSLDGDPPTPGASAAQPLPPLSGREALSAIAYLAGKLVTIKSAALAAAAAAILLAGVLLVPWGAGPQAPAPGAQAPANEPRPRPTTAPAVATLTDQHQARWDLAPGSVQPAVGSALVAGQRLILAEGFAEVTTVRGAVVILQAPCTVQMLDNDNALYLSAGKLVGVVEQDSAKGFWVRTRQADITDLGTRFGVDATRPDATDVHVFEGEVRASRADALADAQRILLTANQSARVTAGSDQIVSIDHDTKPFAAIKPSVTRLPGSGVGIERGEEDARWTVVAVDGQPLASPHVLRVSIGHDQFGDLQIDPAIAQWLAWNPGHQPNAQGYNTYRFQTHLDLPDEFDPRTTQLVLDYKADTRIRRVLINGQLVIDAPGSKGDEVGNLNDDNTFRLILDQSLIPGRNLIQIDIENHLASDGSPAAAVGLIAAWELRTNNLTP